MSYRLLDCFRSLFESKTYLHRNATLGDSVARCLPEDLYELRRSDKFNARVDARERVLNAQNRLRGKTFRRGDGTFGELVPQVQAEEVAGFRVARGPVATVEIGVEVKILAKAMIKQIDRVITDLRNQRRQFDVAGGTPIAVGIVGINQAARYISHEGDMIWPTTGLSGHRHPIQEAAEAERRLLQKAAPDFDEFLVLRFSATNDAPHAFQWFDQRQTELDYGAALTRILRRYGSRF